MEPSKVQKEKKTKWCRGTGLFLSYLAHVTCSEFTFIELPLPDCFFNPIRLRLCGRRTCEINPKGPDLTHLPAEETRSPCCHLPELREAVQEQHEGLPPLTSGHIVEAKSRLLVGQTDRQSRAECDVLSQQNHMELVSVPVGTPLDGVRCQMPSCLQSR